MKKKKVIIYARVSTSDRQEVGMQVESCRSFASRAFDNHDIVVIEDVGISGSVAERPGLDRLMAEVRSGRVDSVVCWKFDRFARSTAHLLEILTTCQRMKTQFVSVTEGIDTSTPVGQMVFTFLAAIGQFERDLIKERVKAGMAHARAQGKHLGRPKRDVDVRAMTQLLQAGTPLAETARALGVSRGVVRRRAAELGLSTMVSGHDDTTSE